METKVVESKQVIIVEQANPQVVYVPSYNPIVVYGAPVYPYPPIAYPPPGYYAAGMAISFGVGVAMGAMWSGGWGYHCGWGGNNNVYINNNNNFVNNSNRQNINNVNRNTNNVNRGNAGNNTWQHNPQHRGGAPYSDRSTSLTNTVELPAATACRHGRRMHGRTRLGSSPRVAATRPTAERDRRSGTRDAVESRKQPLVPVTATRQTAGRVPAQALETQEPRRRSNQVGNRQVPNSPSSTNRGAFGGASSGTSGSQARASSSRGSSSMGGSVAEELAQVVEEGAPVVVAAGGDK